MTVLLDGVCEWMFGGGGGLEGEAVSCGLVGLSCGFGSVSFFLCKV